MPDPLYTRLEAKARRLIAKYGKPGEIIFPGTPSGPAYDPQNSADVLIACVLVETGYSLTNRNETLVVTGDKLGIISTDVAVAPENKCMIEIDGSHYQIIDLQPLNPGGLVLLYEFQARA